jgi:hypothetical protein
MTADYEKLKRKHLNAIKHGVFSSMAILPGEDLDEYGALLEAFSSEWSPEGPTEVDAVYTLTNCVWRKRRIRKSIAQKVELRSLDPDHPAFDPDLVLGPANVAFQQLDPKQLEILINEIPALRKHLEKKFPEHCRDWLEPADLAKKFTFNDSKELFERGRVPEPRVLRELHRADVVGEDLFKQELAMEERLDGMIDRALKRLVQAKAMKQMLASPSLNGQAQQPKRISSSK